MGEVEVEAGGEEATCSSDAVPKAAARPQVSIGCDEGGGGGQGPRGRAAEVPAWGTVEAPEAEVSQQSRRPERWVGDHGSPQGTVSARRQHRSAREVELGQPAVGGGGRRWYVTPNRPAVVEGPTAVVVGAALVVCGGYWAAPTTSWAVPAVVEVGRGVPAAGWTGWGRLRGAAVAGCPAAAWRIMGPRSRIAMSSNIGGSYGCPATEGGMTEGSASCRKKSKAEAGGVVIVCPRGKEDSSNMMCLEMMMRFDDSSRHRYPLWEVG
jgi:hypothetical protein